MVASLLQILAGISICSRTILEIDLSPATWLAKFLHTVSAAGCLSVMVGNDLRTSPAPGTAAATEETADFQRAGLPKLMA